MLIPPDSTGDARRLLAARGLRAAADGLVSVLLPSYLVAQGYSPAQIGLLVTTTLLGSAAVTLAMGLLAHRWSARRSLSVACMLMTLTGAGFAAPTASWWLWVVAFFGTLNPTAGDVSLFLPLEQALLARTTAPSRWTALYARWNLVAQACGAIGALASAVPAWLSSRSGVGLVRAMSGAFLVYAAIGGAAWLLYRGLDPAIDAAAVTRDRRPLRQSRAIVLRLAALFTLDSFGGGFVTQSLLALWLFRRFELSVATVAQVFFATAILAAVSQLTAAWLARRIGLVRTMVVTHIPANVFLLLAAVAPSAPVAIACLLLRATLSSMDVPARQALVMAVVPVDERAAAASVTNVPRSLGAGLAPWLAGWWLTQSVVGWPLLVAGALKIVYDVLLYVLCRHRQVDTLH
ncbi:MAG: MFS transporter [Vicinamibacterales bacterium]